MVSSYTDKRGIWVIDRGADRERLFYPLLKGHHRFIIRLVGMRDLLYRRVPVNSLKMVLWCPCPYNDTIIRTEHGKEKSYSVQYGFLPVRLPGHPKTPLWLFVMRGLGAKPLMLLTTQPLRRNRQVLKNVFLAYVKRWSIEETIRFVKQTYDLENIRLLRYVSLKNMMALVLVVFYFLAVVLDTHQKLKILAGHVLGAAKRVFGIPDFKYYALRDGICAIFRRNPGRIKPKPPKPSVWQLSLKYT